MTTTLVWSSISAQSSASHISMCSWGDMALRLSGRFRMMNVVAPSRSIFTFSKVAVLSGASLVSDMVDPPVFPAELFHPRRDAGPLHLFQPQSVNTRILVLELNLVAALFDAERGTLLLSFFANH